MSAGQISLDFTQKRPPEVQAAIAEGMAKAEEHADKFWKAVIHGCINDVALMKPRLTVDDVLDRLDIVNRWRQERGLPVVDTHHLCAIGPAMKRAAFDKIITPTNEVMRSRRDVKHGNRHKVWLSNHFRR